VHKGNFQFANYQRVGNFSFYYWRDIGVIAKSKQENHPKAGCFIGVAFALILPFRYCKDSDNN